MADPIKHCDDLAERLTPYVDGEDQPADRAAVGAHLNRCPPCRKHADDERTGRDLVREHRAGLCPPAPAALRDRCLQLRETVGNQATAGRGSAYGAMIRRWAPLSVAATLVLAIAGVFVFGLNHGVEALAASLAIDHVKCFKVSARERAADASSAARQWQQDEGWPVAVPASAPAEQLRLLDVRRCYSTDGKAAHIMYKWRGAPLSVFVLPAETGHDTIVHKVGQRAVIWSANRRTYAIVDAGDSPPDEINRVVSYLKANVQ